MSDAKKERPKAGTYPTFTSLKKRTTLIFQKPEYGRDEFKIQKLINEGITLTLEAGKEFDVYRECLGEGDFKGNPFFVKLLTKGFTKLSKAGTQLDPNDLQRYLEAQVGSGTNKVILWKDRPRPDSEKRLEEAVAGKQATIDKMTAEGERMRALLKKHNIAVPE